mmetsp:Transcript_45744/g.96002  ORF Transcript_45744/g.96002 Transcript_45744/m.96002 type:complete len:280 (-) Transcript_45744:1880-2719(-)
MGQKLGLSCHMIDNGMPVFPEAVHNGFVCLYGHALSPKIFLVSWIQPNGTSNGLHLVHAPWFKKIPSDLCLLKPSIERIARVLQATESQGERGNSWNYTPSQPKLTKFGKFWMGNHCYFVILLREFKHFRYPSYWVLNHNRKNIKFCSWYRRLPAKCNTLVRVCFVCSITHQSTIIIFVAGKANKLKVPESRSHTCSWLSGAENGHNSLQGPICSCKSLVLKTLCKHSIKVLHMAPITDHQSIPGNPPDTFCRVTPRHPGPMSKFLFCMRVGSSCPDII